jgi:phage FluMu protein Com
MLGTNMDILLRCKARAWPYPTYQWYRNGKILAGATAQELRLRLSSTLNTQIRTYRCRKCGMVSRKVPVNAYHVRCRNCSVVFAYNEATEYDQFVQKLKDEEAVLLEEKFKLAQLLQRLKLYHDSKHDLLLQDATKRFADTEMALTRLREARYFDKYDIELSNRFTDEGVYCCYVKNLRGGSMPMITKSNRVVVAVQQPEPFLLDVRPQFNARPLAVRKRWTTYSSILGGFIKGRLCGIVTVRYSDSSFYEGPYIGEEWIDTMGNLNPAGKAPNHYGVYTLPDGRIFEGRNVDNHFDPFNLQQNYKLKLPNGETYDGMFSDEEYHGIGIYYFNDGSVYEGEWHRGMRFGHGQFRSCEGWTYEGFFDSNRRHGEGAINWPDGSFYIGEWYFEKITGRGAYVSRLRDVYRGDLLDSIFHGFGELLYTSGARYVGGFKMGKKFGKGVYMDVNGNEYYGIYADDELDGEVVVKSIIKIEERGQDNFEVKVGVYKNGKLLDWKVKFSHPIATKEFIKLFDDNSAMYDSVYSMMLAKNLPDVPDGVDMNNKDVRRIVTRIRDEAGDLVSEHALQLAHERIGTIRDPILRLKEEFEALKTAIEQNEARALGMEQEASMLMNKFSVIIDIAEKEAKKAEQYWVDDPREIRGKHNEAVKRLATVHKDQFFDFKSHRFPPPFVKKILDAISCLLNSSRDWKLQQLLLSDSLFNAREGDEQALRFRYDCKLVHMLKDYDVYNYCAVDHGVYGGDLGKILADPRFRRDSYYVESCGEAAPFLVDWIKINYAYVSAAKNNLALLKSSEEKRTDAFRLKAVAVKKREDLGPLMAQTEADKKRLLQIEEEVAELEIALAKANNMLLFLQETFEVSKSKERKLDYYERMEIQMEQKRDFLQIETALRVCVDGVESRMQDEKQLKMKLAAARGQVYVEEIVTRPQLTEWITSEISEQQTKVISGGRTLGYSYEAEPNALTEDETQVYINLVVDLVMLRMNERFNDLATATVWTTHKGHRFSSRFLYASTWKYWKELAVKVEDDKAVEAWESIFGSPENCALMAVEARVNERMSKLAREQARVWASRHPQEIEIAETVSAHRFYEYYPENTAAMTLAVIEDTSGAIPPPTLAACICWMKLHPQAISEVKDEMGRQLAEDFSHQFKSETAVDAFRIVSGIATDAEMIWRDQAVEWRTFNETAYNEAAEQQVTQMAKEFRENLSKALDPATEAARIVNSNTIAELITDEECRKEHEQNKFVYFNAHCFQIRNQGLVRAAMAKLLVEQAANAHRMWGELETATENFRKGSYLFVTQEARENVSQDRFYGFRARLLKKFAWLYGYLCYRQIELVKDVNSFESRDPYGKVFHNVRPSEHKKVMREKFEEFKDFRGEVETGLKEIFSKLSVWNTYFGLHPVFSDQSDQMRSVWSVAKDLILDIKKSEGAPPAALLSASSAHMVTKS